MQTEIEQLFDHKPPTYTPEHFDLFYQFKHKLNLGEVRAAQPDASAKNGWRVTPWVKKGILLGFRMGAIVDMSIDRSRQPFFDKATYPVRQFSADDASAHRARRVQHSRRLFYRARRDLHASDVRQRRRVCRQQHHDRFARAGGKLRADRRGIATFPRRRRSAECWSRWARCR